jgi:hypothetical protein
MPKIAIIGGGVAGSTTALYLGNLGMDVTLFERENSLVNGPPFCHLHAGGNFYPDISDEQCLILLKQSIDFVRFYPFIVDYRPTVIALPLTCGSTPKALLPRLELVKGRYEALIHKDSNNKVLGESSEYYRCYGREEIEALQSKSYVSVPKNSDEWMITVAKNIDLDKVQFPLIIVQEYGLNLFRLSSGVGLALNQLSTVSLQTNTIVSNIQEVCNEKLWDVTSIYNDITTTKSFDYVINAAGFRTGLIDDMLGVECKRMVEFKAAYVSHWEATSEILFPEIIFHGKRGTPEGMGQFTPYPQGYFQLHAMTKEITLYDDGLVANTNVSCQPKLGQSFIEKIEKSWTNEEIIERTQSAINHLAKFIPNFAEATVASKPLFGAQQIPGDDPSLRVAEVSFPTDRYARCEIVKVSSVMDMIDTITREFVKLGYIDAELQGQRNLKHLSSLREFEVNALAEMIAQERQYPKELGHRNMVG